MKEQIEKIVAELREDMTAFAQAVVRTQSYTCQEGGVARLVKEKMEALGYDEVAIDPIGNVLGRIGKGEKKLFFDSHMDTVSVIDGPEWEHDPFGGEIVDGRLYGRGAVDMKCPMVASVYGAYIAKRVGLPEDVSLYVSTSVMEEDYDGEAVRELLKRTGLRPDGVVICEPSCLKIGTGHRGRALVEIHMPGIPCHGSSPEKGENPVYALQTVIGRVQALAESLQAKEGEHGSVALTNITCHTASNNSVPADATIILDRRLALGETEEIITREVEALVEGTKADWRFTDVPGTSWNGEKLVLHSFLPAWKIEENHPLVKAAQTAGALMLGREPELFRLGACTNGVATAGVYGLPTIVFGAGDMALAHTKDEYCEVESMLAASGVYAAMALGL